MHSFVLIGHVDHGKTTLGEKILEFYGIRDRLDSEEEKIRSKTQEFTFIKLTDQLRLIDTPGHQSYIRSMIEGLSRFEGSVAVLMVSAREQEFEKGFERGQIKEDIILARSLGLLHLIVFITKTDLYLPPSVAHRCGNIKNTLGPYLNKMAFSTVTFLSGSGVTGEGIPALIEAVQECPPQKISEVGIAHETDRLRAKIKILYLEHIMTAGMPLMVHMPGGREAEAEIYRTTPRILREGDVAVITLHFVRPISVFTKMKLIFRLKNYTIGFGTVL